MEFMVWSYTHRRFQCGLSLEVPGQTVINNRKEPSDIASLQAITTLCCVNNDLLALPCLAMPSSALVQHVNC